MKVVFRVDASLQMGTGHVMRCLTLANELKQKNHEIVFICRELTGNLILLIKYPVLILPKNDDFQSDGLYLNWLGATQEKDAEQTIKAIPKNADLLIVDSYALDEIWHKQLRPYTKKIMVIDDLADRKHSCDILLDQSFGRQQEDYRLLVPKSCELLLGSQYALLRPEFSEWRQYSIGRRKDPVFKELLVNMGGADTDNFTEQVLKELKECDLPSDIKITVVMGETAPHLESVRNSVDTLPYKTEIKVGIDNMAEIMANADIAIGAAGSTTWERCCLGLPTIQVIIAKNQEFSAKVLVNHNVVKLLAEIKEVANLLNTPTDWMSGVSTSAAQICDGMGVYKVLSKFEG